MLLCMNERKSSAVDDAEEKLGRGAGDGRARVNYWAEEAQDGSKSRNGSAKS